MATSRPLGLRLLPPELREEKSPACKPPSVRPCAGGPSKWPCLESSLRPRLSFAGERWRPREVG